MIRTLINLEPGGDQSRSSVLAEVTVTNISHGSGRISNDYAWRIRSVDAYRKKTTSYGCLVDSHNDSAVELLWKVLCEWKSGRPHPIDNHGQSRRLITDDEAFWKNIDTVSLD